MSEKINRLSIMMDKELEDKLREMQANMIKKTKRNVSFSYVVNLVLKKGLKVK